MLEPWIIEQIRRREEEERRRHEQPRLEIPVRDERWKRDRPPGEDEEEDEDKDRDGGNRGVVIIDI
ncbi:MAG TPA: hypothetical protein VIQ54_12740 [Polyangia bacterium]